MDRIGGTCPGRHRGRVGGERTAGRDGEGFSRHLGRRPAGSVRCRGRGLAVEDRLDVVDRFGRPADVLQTANQSAPRATYGSCWTCSGPWRRSPTPSPTCATPSADCIKHGRHSQQPPISAPRRQSSHLSSRTSFRCRSRSTIRSPPEPGHQPPEQFDADRILPTLNACILAGERTTEIIGARPRTNAALVDFGTSNTVVVGLLPDGRIRPRCSTTQPYWPRRSSSTNTRPRQPGSLALRYPG